MRWALDRRPLSHSPTLEWPIIRGVLPRLGRLFAAGQRPRLRNTSGIQHDLRLGHGSLPKGGRGPPRDKPEDPKYASRFGGTPILQKRPSMKNNVCFSKGAGLKSARPMSAKKRCWPKAKHNQSRSKSHLIIGDDKVGGALTRREQSPEPERLTHL